MVVQVFCDRHYGGINYPRGGVGRIAELLVDGLQERGSNIEYKANVSALQMSGLSLHLAAEQNLGNSPSSGGQLAGIGCCLCGPHLAKRDRLNV